MQELFSTDAVAVRNQFRTWQEIARERFVPFAQTRLNEGAFHARLDGASIGPLVLTRSTFDPVRLEMTPHATRRSPKRDSVAVVLRIAGTAMYNQYDRSTIHRPGELVVMESRAPVVSEFRERTEALLIELPRERLESLLGPARMFAGMTGGSELPGTRLARSFLDGLVRLHAALSPAMAERMGNIAIDLVVASLAERMAMETPGPLQATVTLQRAKSFVEANLGDTTLDPSKVAGATGISLRQLQQLFQQNGHQVSEWIWQRRLRIAAMRLADPAQVHLAIGTIAHGCGFGSQQHFSKRFRERFGLTAGAYRRQALDGAVDGSSRDRSRIR